jgi:hypothetical protein
MIVFQRKLCCFQFLSFGTPEPGQSLNGTAHQLPATAAPMGAALMGIQSKAYCRLSRIAAQSKSMQMSTTGAGPKLAD